MSKNLSVPETLKPFSNRVDIYRQRVESALENVLPPQDTAPRELHEAMRYSVLGDGKRIRPLLVYAAGEILGGDPKRLDPPAVAIELVHAFSLVHDDLPAMDDDDLRRGQPTTHKAFGEDVAILAGDALQVLAFGVLASSPSLTDLPEAQVACIRLLADATGSVGMTGGQAIDLASEGGSLTAPELEHMFACKTGELIRAAVVMGGYCAGGSAENVERLGRFGRAIGLAFQIRDDVLDVEGETDVIGKTQGADEARGKATYPSLFGIDNAKKRADELYEQSMQALEPLGEAAEPLRWVARYIVRRDN